MSVLIITSTVNVNSCLTVLVNPKIRLEQYVNSILFYLNSKKIDKLIVCDNSSFDYSAIEVINKLAVKNNKKIEFLNFNGSANKIQEFGKGYGEGEIMSFIFMNSELIRQEEFSFLKVTGRLKVLNIDSILNFCEPNINYYQPTSLNPFIKSDKIDTRFYQCNKLMFNEFLKDRFQYVNDIDGIYLEHVYYNRLIDAKIRFENFRILPYFIGISGSTGDSYKISDFKFLRNRFIFFIYKYFNKLNLIN
ncbi:MAG: hypothetical protein A3F91_12465 [Flavobacteria bacterium RIFCSPLOWO2_12_FULL_35_11]|nr:MAG: hypothetical protein A3F91_12465 [Flavobacteria bacterium RIFCSPLOWO2_12_FULL_35_11]